MATTYNNDAGRQKSRNISTNVTEREMISGGVRQKYGTASMLVNRPTGRKEIIGKIYFYSTEYISIF
jgi:hypothetical protein